MDKLVQKNNVTVSGNTSANRTIVFGHGFGIDQTTFTQLAANFEQDYRIVMYDNVGGGKSDMSAYSQVRYNSLHGYVADLKDIFTLLDIQDAIFVGHSVSSMIGMLTAIQYPAFFSRLVMLGASPRYLNDPAQNYTGGFNPEDLAALYDAMRTNYQAWASGFSALAMANPERPQLAETFAAGLQAIRPDIALAVAKVIFESDHRADLAKNTIPALVVQTANDIAVPVVVGDYLHRHLQGSKLVQVNTHGHFPHMSAPGEVYQAIAGFL
ncbi:alpha/beta fold hydrolase [Deminuibacter soli]|uniref:Alpha/beta hydrolase n=1 Tax=Deminuibacter soli TaxID=2291815 RepID=A0A3E1NEZ9_9BACT|nr:alpha/beta hydrolase [Deminuibacter soli]RFM26358.1 alpha/beta hydrolase [Deminuibacter soli]